MTPPEELPVDTESTTELLARRTQLQEWLARLDQVGADIPTQVARRVREDYEQRLSTVVSELAAHSEALAADRERLDEKRLAAAERHDGAVDGLEEVRLRHLIGEISDEEWDGRRPGLEAEVEAAAAERAEAEQEIAALEDLFAQIAAGAAVEGEVTLEHGVEVPEAAAEGVVADSAVAGFAGAADDWDPELPVLEPESEAPENEAPEMVERVPAQNEISPEQPLDVGELQGDAVENDGGTHGAVSPDDDLVEITNFAAAAEALANEVDPAPSGDDDYAFLEELDRAIAATAPNTDSRSDDDEPSEETRPQPGLKCPDCGYSNDPAAWYCGVCGVDLG